MLVASTALDWSYSIWSGHLKNGRDKPLLDWPHRHGVPLDECHTLGHAAVKNLV